MTQIELKRIATKLVCARIGVLAFNARAHVDHWLRHFVLAGSWRCATFLVTLCAAAQRTSFYVFNARDLNELIVLVVLVTLRLVYLYFARPAIF